MATQKAATGPTPSAPATDNKLLMLIALILASGVVFLDSTVVNVALAAIDREFKEGLASLQWVVDGYTLTLAAFLILGGAVGDQFGRKKTMLFGLVGFGIISILCGLSPSVFWLTIARLAQGVAGAFLVPGSLAIITAVYTDPTERGKAIGNWSAWGGITSLLGPFLGGYLVDNLSWRWVFFINIPIVLLTLWLLWRYVPETHNPHANRHLDVAGALLAVLGLGGTTFALIEGPTSGWGNWPVLVGLIGGIAALVFFLVVEARSPNPMLPLGLFRSRNFSGANLATFGMYFGLYGVSFLLTIYVQSIMGHSAIEAGLVLLPISIIMFFLSPYTGRWAGQYGPRLFMTVGPILYAAGLLIIFLFLHPDSSLWLVMLPTALVMGAGLVLTVAPLTNAVMASVSADSSGTASAVNNVVSRVGGLLAVAGLGVVVSSVFQNLFSQARQNLPASAQAAVDQAAQNPTTARLSSHLPPDQLNLILDSYTSAFHWAILVCAIMAAIGGVISFLLIRNPTKTNKQINKQPA